MPDKPGPERKGETIDLSQTAAQTKMAEPEFDKDVWPVEQSDMSEEPRREDRAGGPPSYPDWALGHLIPFDIDDRLITIFNCAAALCRFKAGAQTVLSSSTLIFGVIETALRFPLDAGSDPAFRILDLLRARGLMDSRGLSDQTRFGQLRNSYFLDPVPEKLSVTEIEAERMELSGNVASTLSAMASETDGQLTATDFLTEIFKRAASRSEDGLFLGQTLNADRFGFGDELGAPDYIAALVRNRAPDPTVIKRAFFEDAQSASILVYAPDEIILKDIETASADLPLKDDSVTRIASGHTESEIVTALLGNPEGRKGRLLQLVGWARLKITDVQTGEFDLEPIDYFGHAPVSLSGFHQIKSGIWETGFLAGIAKKGDEIHEVFRRLVSDASFSEPSTAEPETELASDRPEVLVDKLGRAELALALAKAVNEICEDQVFQHEKSDPKGFWKRWSRKNTENAAFTLHIDAPWGGGKTTFANFLAAVLNPEIHDPDFFSANRQRCDVERDFGQDSVLARLFDPLRSAYNPQTKSGWKWRDKKWIPVWFNAWEHQHVQPPWWDFRQSIRREYRRHLGYWHWIKEIAAELSWRFFTPKVQWTLFFSLLFLGLGYLGYFLFRPSPQPTTSETNFFSLWMGKAWSLITNAPPAASESSGPSGTLLLTLFGAGSVTALITSFRSGLREMVLAASSSFDPAKLGVTDPLKRFSRRFVNSLASSRRPVIVFIDDLDRCNPAYVVELLRGLLTIFKSRYVVFVLLGDKAWIERALEVSYEEMLASHGEEEVGFGARFAEKVIQMSFLLPKVEESAQEEYLRGLLPGQGAPDESAAQIVDFVARSTAEVQQAQTNADAARAIERATADLATLPEASPQQVAQVQQQLSRAFSVQRTTRAETQAETAAGLLEFVDLLPNNPRRLKRINNLVSMYQESALVVQYFTPGSSEWKSLVVWIILMSEHPKVWRMLCEAPQLWETLYMGWAEIVHWDRWGDTSLKLPHVDGAEEWLDFANTLLPRHEILQLLVAQTDDAGDLIRADTVENLRARLYGYDADTHLLLNRFMIDSLRDLTPIA